MNTGPTGTPPTAIVVMGPSGCGKTTLANALADDLGWTFIEGDDCHPPANRAKMASGTPLDDTDREPFLDAVGRALAAPDGGAVAACSSLKRTYRDRLRARAGNILFVLPCLPQSALEQRMTARSSHFMPLSLLSSQLATLELPTPDENVCLVAGDLPTREQVALVLSHISVSAADSP